MNTTDDDVTDGHELDDVQRKIDDARDKAREHDLLPDVDDEPDQTEEEAIDGLTRPGLG